MLSVRRLPSKDRITENWLSHLHAQYPNSNIAHMEPQLRAAVACLYKTLYGDPAIWDVRGLMLVLTPQPSFRDVVQVFIALRIAVRESLKDCDAETILHLLETLDVWVQEALTSFDRVRERKTESLWQNTIQRIAQLNTLSHFMAKLNVSLDLPSAFSASVELARQLSGADLCAIYQQEGHALHLRAYASEGAAPATMIPVSDSYVMEQVIIDHGHQDPVQLATIREKLAMPEIQALYCLPLQTNNITTGKLAFIYFDRTALSLQELRVYEIFAGQVAQTIYNAQLYEQVVAFTAANERWQIACEMHDTLLQTLVSLNINLRVLQEQAQQGNWEDVGQLIDSARELGHLAVQEGRNTLHDLRQNNCTCQSQNLIDALQMEIATFADRAQITPAFTYDDDIYLTSNVNHHLCRLVGEALTNIHRHAHASRVDINLCSDHGVLVITVQDDGVGFQTNGKSSKTSFGLIGMQERARFINAAVSVESTPGTGTSVIIHFPLKHRKSQAAHASLPDVPAFPARQMQA